jgi:uncharacterized protein involved in tolerance to divalent cations
MSRMIDVFAVLDEKTDAVEIARQVVQEHLAAVSYVVPTRVFCRNGDQILDNPNGTLLIIKSKDTVFQDKLIPLLKQAVSEDFVHVSALPAVDVVDDYRKWVSQEVHENS